MIPQQKNFSATNGKNIGIPNGDPYSTLADDIQNNCA